MRAKKKHTFRTVFEELLIVGGCGVEGFDGGCTDCGGVAGGGVCEEGSSRRTFL